MYNLAYFLASRQVEKVSAWRAEIADNGHGAKWQVNQWLGAWRTTLEGTIRVEIPFQAVLSLLSLQFVVFGWRVVREIALMEKNRKTWLLLEDYGNLACMLLVLALCIIYPLGLAVPSSTLPLISRSVFVAACAVLVLYPVCLAAHYGLLIGQRGRPQRRLSDGSTDWAHLGVLEGFIVVTSWSIAFFAGFVAYKGWF